MSHTRAVCQHGITISQCRCTSGHKITKVVRPCPFGSQHLGMVVVHPEPPTAGPQEPPQAPEGEPLTPGPVSQVPPGASGAAEGFGPRAVKACVFRTCAWTLPEESGPTLAAARRREEEQLIDHLQAEHAEAIRQMWEAIR